MITLTNILAGEVARTKKVFNIEGVGNIELTKLSITDQKKAFNAMDKKPKNEDETQEVETTILNSVYYMLKGEHNPTEAKKLEDVLDDVQISQIFKAGYFWLDLSIDKLEQTEKN